MRFGSRRAFRNLLLLAPPSSIHHGHFGFCQTNDDQHQQLLSEAQRLRARVYIEDGAIDPGRVSRDGRLVHAHDEHSWQLLVIDTSGRVAGCARYIPHQEDVRFSELGVARSALAGSHPWGSRLRRAVEMERTKAHRRGMNFAEVGGWALSKELRYSTAALEIFMNVCALAKLFGGTVAITTATFRHHSASILRRLGGRTLVNDGVELPPYYDPQYNCEMEILKFDSECPNPKYVERIDQCRNNLVTVPAICATSLSEEYAMSY